MSRSATALDWQGRQVALVAAALCALLGSFSYVALQAALEARPPPAGPASAAVTSAAAGALITAPAPAPAPASAPGPTREAAKEQPVAAANPTKSRMPSGNADMPYRFIGKSVAGGETSIVLFGRGRVVALQGPGPVDDEYMVEAVFDEYLVLRHGPTGVGRFLQLAQRQQAVEPARDPEESPRD